MLIFGCRFAEGKILTPNKMKITIDTSAYTVQKIVEDGELDTRDKKLARQILTKQIEFFNSLLPEANEIDKETIVGKRDLMAKARREI